MNRLRHKRLYLLFAVATVAWLAAPRLAAASYYTAIFDNGLRARIYPPEGILADLAERDSEGRLLLRLPSGEYYFLIDDITDPEIANKGDGRFHPMSEELVKSALEEVDVEPATMNMEIDVFILPFPRSRMLASSSRRNMIFLSPGVYEMDRRVVSYIVTHELGHTYQYNYLPDWDSEGWYRYLTLRGIYGNPTFSAQAAHMNRPKEIFAEDFRFLFGGEAARYSGSIENHNLPTPDLVEGLEEFMVSLAPLSVASKDMMVPSAGDFVTVGNYPNPFNPRTTMRAVLSEDAVRSGRPLDLRIYRVDGSLVRHFELGKPRVCEVEVSWDGLNDRGTPVGSGFYLYRFTTGRDTRAGKMFLIR
jgi:hypothetical protein